MAVLTHGLLWPRRLVLQVLTPLVCFVAVPSLRAEAQTLQPGLEYRVKAAYLLNFSRYVEWPSQTFPTPSAPIRICVLGEDPFGATLSQTVARQRTQGRDVQSVQVPSPEAVISVGCQVLYIAAEQRPSRHWQSVLRGHPIVTVSEGEDFLDEGGMIGFVLIEESVRFAVSLPAVHGAGLQISSRVLSLATRVLQDPRS
jgi:hypothetical protein